MENSDTKSSIYVFVNRPSLLENQSRPMNSLFVFQCSLLIKYLSPEATTITTQGRKKTFSFEIPSLTLDEGTPESQSWGLISEMLSNMNFSFDLEEPHKRFFWREIGIDDEWKAVKKKGEIIKHILDTARCMAFRSSSDSETGIHREVRMELNIYKEMSLPHDRIKGIREGYLSFLRRMFSATIEREYQLHGRRYNIGQRLSRCREDFLRQWNQFEIDMELKVKILEMLNEQMENWSHWESLRPKPAAFGDALLEDVVVAQNASTSASIACSICREELDGSEDMSRMPCSHVFHKNCILEWFKNGHVCPLCRFELPTE